MELGRAAFTVLLVMASVSDIRSRRIPNALVVVLALLGMLFAFMTMPPVQALRYALGGGAVGLAIWLPFWLLRVLGAGDVKLAAAAGMWLGVAGTVEASLFGAAVGGVLAVWAMARAGGIRDVVTRFSAWLLASRVSRRLLPELTPVDRRVPYGVALSVGAIVAGWFPGLIW